MRGETSPEDIHGMLASEGIVTDARRHDQPRGGGCPRHGQALRLRRRSLRVDYKTGTLLAQGTQLKKAMCITIDGSNGQVLKVRWPMFQPELSGDFAAIMEWADKIRR